MTLYDDYVEKNGFRIPHIYLPSKNINYEKWAVVACDQYSSEKEYWEKTKKNVGSNASTLNLIFPECYLEDADKNERITDIKKTMDFYLKNNIVEDNGLGIILVDRTTPFEKQSRKGLIIMVDLEKYEYGSQSKSLIRPTEGTIVERLPPRMEIRRSASLELPHIMLLIDDQKKQVIEPMYAKKNEFKKLYDFDLMNNCGHITAYHITSENDIVSIATAINALADAQDFYNKYNTKDVLLFAVGDGNHSLATAKSIWEETKRTLSDKTLLSTHPARYALVELVNIYDDGLPFHPIHRVLFNVDEEVFFTEITNYAACKVTHFNNPQDAFSFTDQKTQDHRVAVITKKRTYVIDFINPKETLAAGTIQIFLDNFLAKYKVNIDYIHGSESLISLSTQDTSLGLYLPPIDKNSFFATIIHKGVMPRKTFSMGEAPEKRFYIEARKIIL